MERRGFFARLTAAIAGVFGVSLSVNAAKAFMPISSDQKCVAIGDELYFGCKGELSSKMSPFRELSRNSNAVEIAEAVSKSIDVVRREMSTHALTPTQRFACEQSWITLWGLHASITRPCVPGKQAFRIPTLPSE